MQEREKVREAVISNTEFNIEISKALEELERQELEISGQIGNFYPESSILDFLPQTKALKGVAVLGVEALRTVAKKVAPKGLHGIVGGHHIYSKAAFKESTNYNARTGFAISQGYMKSKGWNHVDMTNAQRQAFKELKDSGRANTMREHTRIAVDALEAGGATQSEARSLVGEALRDMRAQGVRAPTNIPWGN